MDWEWIENAFSTLPGCNDSLFLKLWKEGRLRFGNSPNAVDAVDEYSARFVCSALVARRSVFIGLPDFQLHRPALLLATALIREWYDTQDDASRAVRPVLYFGTAIGIREQLRQTSIRDMQINLASVFRQVDLGRSLRSNSFSDGPVTSLPKIITIYSPADPAALISDHNPRWIAIDCGDVPSCAWLSDLLKSALDKRITVVAWGQNPLAETIAEFEKVGDAFLWPLNSARGSNIRSIIERSMNFAIQPLVLAGAESDALSLSLKTAWQKLAEASRRTSGRLGKDTLNVHWRYLRGLEALSVPMEFHEVEATRFWGLIRFEEIRSVCIQFQAAFNRVDPMSRGLLDEAMQSLNRAKMLLGMAEPPIWDALGNLCFDEPQSGAARLIVFSSRSRRDLFLSALLARHNLTEQDMRAWRVWVVSLDDLQRWERYLAAIDGDEPDPMMPHEKLKWQPLFVGLPSQLSSGKLLSAFLRREVEFLIYPHQLPALRQRVDKWSQRLTPDKISLLKILGGFAREVVPQVMAKERPRLSLRRLISVDVQNGKKVQVDSVGPIWVAQDAAVEIARLLNMPDDWSENSPVEDQIEKPAIEIEGDANAGILCDEAVEVHFIEEWKALFAPNEIINVVVTDMGEPKIDQRFVRSLRPGNTVLFIHGQRRQNLYELILNRIHRHPSIELHIALIRRWQDDFRRAYSRWDGQRLTQNRSFEHRDTSGLLKAMRDIGCKLSSELTIQLWLGGQTLCPSDPEDLRRLAEVLELTFVRQHYIRIHGAATRLRGLHVGLSRRLNMWLKQQTTGSSIRFGDEVIDRELGLTFEDFRSSLLSLHVKSVERKGGPFLRNNLGMLINIDAYV